MEKTVMAHRLLRGYENAPWFEKLNDFLNTIPDNSLYRQGLKRVNNLNFANVTPTNAPATFDTSTGTIYMKPTRNIQDMLFVLAHELGHTNERDRYYGATNLIDMDKRSEIFSNQFADAYRKGWITPNDPDSLYNEITRITDFVRGVPSKSLPAMWEATAPPRRYFDDAPYWSD